MHTMIDVIFIPDYVMENNFQNGKTFDNASDHIYDLTIHGKCKVICPWQSTKWVCRKLIFEFKLSTLKIQYDFIVTNNCIIRYNHPLIRIM